MAPPFPGGSLRDQQLSRSWSVCSIKRTMMMRFPWGLVLPA